MHELQITLEIETLETMEQNIKNLVAEYVEKAESLGFSEDNYNTRMVKILNESGLDLYR